MDHVLTRPFPLRLLSLLLLLLSLIPPAPAAAQTSGVSLSGTVTNDRGQPLAGIAVSAKGLAYAYGRAITNSAGAYTIVNLPPDSYRVVFTDSTGGYKYEYYDDMSDDNAATLVPVGSQDVTGIDAVLSKGASIRGSVTDEQGRPLAGISVSAGSQLGDVSSSTTDSTGAYTVTELAISSYRLSFYDPAGGYRFEYYNNTTNYFSATLVPLGSQDVSGIDAALSQVYRVSGRVRNEQGQPLASIDVELQGALPEQTQLERTDATGSYTFTNVVAGSYRVRYSDPRFRYQTAFYENSSDAASAMPVTVSTQDVTGIDAVLSAGVAVRGRVTNEQAQAIQGITARIQGYPSGIQKETQTDATGAYTFTEIWPGSYLVDFRDDSGIYMPEYFDNKPYYSGDTPMSVGNQDVAGIDAVLSRAAAISGVATDTQGRPIQGALVEIRPVGGGSSPYAHTDATGTYTATGVIPGTYTVRFSHASGAYLSAYYRSDPSSPQPGQVTVGHGQHPTDIGATLYRASSLSGVVTDAQGRILSGVTVRLYVDAGSGTYVAAGSQYSRFDGSYSFTYLGAGSYKLRFEQSGDYAHVYYPAAGTLSAATPLTLGEGEARRGLTGVLPPAARIAGNVTAAVTGQPAPVTVEVLADEGGVWTPVQSVFASSGSYEVGNLAAGVYRVRFSSVFAGYSPEFYQDAATLEAAVDLTLATGQRLAGIDAALEPGGSISGVLTSAGVPVTDATLALFEPHDGQWLTHTYARPGPDGRYRFEALQPGVYRVGVFGIAPQINAVPAFYDGALSMDGAKDIVVGHAQAVTGIDLDLPRGGVISGVVRSGGARRAGVEVRLLKEGDSPWNFVSAVTDEQGRYAFPQLTTGSYLIEFAPSSPYGSIHNLLAPEFYLDAPDLASAMPVSVTVGQVTSNIDADLAALEGLSQGFQLYNPVGPTEVAVGAAARFEAAIRGGRNVRFSWSVDGGPPTDGAVLDVSFAKVGGHAVILSATDGTITQTTHVVVEALGAGPSRGAITGQARSADRTPLSGVRVVAMRVVAPLPPMPIAETFTGGDGRYILSDLLAGEYLLSFFDPRTYRDKRYNHIGSQESASLVSVVGGATTSDIDVTFEPPAPPAAIVSGGGVIRSDPETGLLSITVDRQRQTDLRVLRAVTCEGGAPSEVTLWLGTTGYAMDESPAGSGIFGATIPAADLHNGGLEVTHSCADEAQEAPIGSVMLFDPSGIIRDVVTGELIDGAVVTLYQVPGYRPKLDQADGEVGTCESLASLGERTWDDLPAADTRLGVIVVGDPSLISPQINPQITGSDGYYGWNVARGCWYVTVEAPGYARRVSPIVGVPPAVADLHLALTPLEPGQVPSINFAADAVSADEDAGVARVTVTLSRVTDSPVSVMYRSAGGTAEVGLAYHAALGTITFAPGETSKQIELALLNDRLPGEPHTIAFELSRPIGALLGSRTRATVTIEDWDRYRLYLPLTTR